MTEAEFERRLGTQTAADEAQSDAGDSSNTVDFEATPRAAGSGSSRPRNTRTKATKPRRVQRMFAIEEELDKKLWLYAIHLGKDRSEVINDLLRPIVASMVLYDSRDRRGSRGVEPVIDRSTEVEGD
jgi:hypothetical protein